MDGLKIATNYQQRVRYVARLNDFFLNLFVFEITKYFSLPLIASQLYNCKASSVLANYVVVLSLDKDRAAYSTA